MTVLRISYSDGSVSRTDSDRDTLLADLCSVLNSELRDAVTDISFIDEEKAAEDIQNLKRIQMRLEEMYDRRQADFEELRTLVHQLANVITDVED